MPERLCCWIVLMLAGNLFAVMMDMPPLGAASGWKLTPFLFTLLALMAPLSSLYTYAEVIMSSDEMNSVWSESKLRMYLYIYLHLPCAAGFMLAGVGVSHTHCGHPSFEQSIDANTALLVGGGLALANFTLGLLSCTVMSPVQLWRPAMRCVAAVLLAVVLPLWHAELGCAGFYAVIVCINLGQLFCSYRAKPVPDHVLAATTTWWVW
jgi:low temperature requirement protein LtrA